MASITYEFNNKPILCPTDADEYKNTEECQISLFQTHSISFCTSVLWQSIDHATMIDFSNKIQKRF